MPSFLSSDNLGQLAKALAAAQAEMGAAKKTGEAVTKTYKYRYADLAGVIEVSRPVLAKQGLAIIQSTPCDGTTVSVATRLIHADSGEWIESSVTLKAVENTPQSMGSAITYGRRYGWSTLIGLAADEDDDGNKASRDERNQPAFIPADKHGNPLTAPTGFEPWLAVLTKVAEDGSEALRKAWKDSPESHRVYLQNTQRETVDALKAKAAQHDVLVPELPEKAGKK